MTEQNANESGGQPTTLFAFINGQPDGGEGFCGTVLSDRGDFLLEHIVENEDDAPGALGIGSDCHHDIYKEYAPNGYTLVWVAAPLEHADAKAAYALHKAKTEAAVDGKMIIGVDWARHDNSDAGTKIGSFEDATALGDVVTKQLAVQQP